MRLPHPWDSPGKNTGVGCHFLLQCMKVKSESEVAQSCLTLSNPMACSPPGSSVHGIFQARVLEWGAIAFSLWRPTRPFSWLRSATLILIIWSPFPSRSFPCYSRDFPDFSTPLLFHCTWVPTAISIFVQYLFFSVWLISLNIMPSKSICIAVNDEILFFFVAGSIRLLMDT